MTTNTTYIKKAAIQMRDFNDPHYQIASKHTPCQGRIQTAISLALRTYRKTAGGIQRSVGVFGNAYYLPRCGERPASSS